MWLAWSSRQARAQLDLSPTNFLHEIRHQQSRCKDERDQNADAEIAHSPSGLSVRNSGAYGAAHLKFFASSVLPVPRYFATCGYGHNGRVRSVAPPRTRDAAI